MATSIAKASIQIGGSTAGLNTAVNESVAKLSGLATKVVAVLGGIATAKWGFEIFTQGERAEIAFEKMLGSAELAKSTLKQLGDFAAATPFALPQLTKAYQQLLNFKFAAEDIPGILRVAGDAASAMPDGMDEGMSRIINALGQMRGGATTKLEELNQLREAGINAIEYIRREIGALSTAEVTEKISAGQIDSLTGVRAILKGLEADYNGMMDRVGKETVGGLLSSTADNAGRALKSVFDGLMGSDFKAMLSDFNDSLGNMQSVGVAVGNALGGAFTGVVEIFKTIRDVAAGTWDVIKSGLSAITEGPLSSFVGYIKEISNASLSVRGVVLGVLEEFGRAFAHIGDAISMYFISPIRAIVGVTQRALGDILSGFAYLADKLSTFSDTMGEVATKLRGVSEGMEKLGLENIRGAKADMARGFTSADEVSSFFNKLREPKTDAGPSKAMVAGLEAITNSARGTSNSLLDFNKKVSSMGSMIPKMDSHIKDFEAHLKDLNKSAESMTDKYKSPAEKFREEMAKVSDLQSRGLITSGTANSAIADIFRNATSALAPKYSPNTSITAGSSAAQSAIMENRMGGGRNVVDLLTLIKKASEAEAKSSKDLADAIKNQKVLIGSI